ncbi:MAG: O-succinylbenzoate synthase [Candidatus Omnitrophota bacterium]
MEKTTIPVALDESTENNTLEELNHIDGVDVFVLKPNLIGSLETAWQHMLFTQSMAIRPVISSCYESSLGIYTLASLASCLAHESFTGLDTLKFFEKDILKEPLKIERGKLQLESRNITADDIDFSLCEEL